MQIKMWIEEASKKGDDTNIFHETLISQKEVGGRVNNRMKKVQFNGE